MATNANWTAVTLEDFGETTPEAQTAAPAIENTWEPVTLDDFSVAAPTAVSTASQAPVYQPQQAPAQEPIALTPFDMDNSVQSRLTKEIISRPDVTATFNQMWEDGIRDPAEYNEVGNLFFPEFRGFNFTARDIAAGREREAYFAARGFAPPGGVFALTSQHTGLKDPERSEDVVGVYTDAVKRSTANIGNSFIGAGALGADLVGADETADAWLEDYIENQAAIQYEYGAPRTLDEIEDIGDAGLWATDVIGELTPQLLGSMGSGFLARKTVEVGLRRGLQETVEDLVKNGVERELAQEMAKAVLRRRANYGSLAGAFGYTATQESGATFGNTYAATGEKAPLMSLGAGVLAGGLEAILPVRTLRRLEKYGVQDQFQRRFLERVAREGTKDFFIEGGTEAMQEFLQTLPEAVITGESPLTQENFDQMFEAFFRGGFGGATVSVGTETATTTMRAYAGRASQEPAQREEQAPPSADTSAGPLPSQREAVDDPDGFTPETTPDFLKNPVKQDVEPANERGINVDETVETINSLTENWSAMPETIVANNVDELSPALNQAITADGQETAKGAYLPDGRLVLFTDNIANMDEMQSVLFHEALGHGGLNQEFGEELGGVLENLYSQNPDFAQAVDEWMAQKGVEGVSMLEAAEEVLAEASEDGPVSRWEDSGVLATLRDFITKWAQRLGIATENMNTRQVQNILAQAHDRVINGEQQSVTLPGVRYIRSWQVSSSKYVSQDNQYLLSGEGANVYGRGQYSGTSDDTRSYYIRSFNRQAKQRAEQNSVDDSAYAYELELPDDGWLNWHEPLATQEEVVYKALKPLVIQAAKAAEEQYFKDLAEHEDIIAEHGQWSSIEPAPPPFFLDELEFDKLYDQNKVLRDDYDTLEDILLNDIDEGDVLYDIYEQDLQDILEMLEENAQILDRSTKFEDYAERTMAGDAYDFIASNLYGPYVDSQDADKKLNATLHAAGVTGNRVRDGDTQSRVWDSSEVLQASTQNQIQIAKDHFNTQAEIIEQRIENAEAMIAQDIKPEFWQNEIDAALRDYQMFKDGFEKRVKSIEEQYRQTYNYVSFDATESKIVNRFRIDDGRIPDVDQFTDLSTDSQYADSVADEVVDYNEEMNVDGIRYMRDRSREPAKFSSRFKDRGIAGNVNLNRVRTKRGEGVYDFIREAADEAPELASESFESIDARARALNLGLDQIKEMNVGLDPAEAHAVGIALVAKAEQLDRLSAAVADNNATAEQEANFVEAILEMSAIYEKYSEIANNAGRLLAAFKIAKQTSNLEGIRFSRDLNGQAVPNLAEIARKINSNKESTGDVVKIEMSTVDKIADWLNLPRSLMSSVDLSAPLRQGFFLMGTGDFWSAFAKMFSFIGSDRAFDAMIEEAQAKPTYRLMLSSGLAMTTAGGQSLGLKEEMFQSTLAEKIPFGVGSLVRASERTFSGFLNKLRIDTFDSLVKDMSASGELPTNLIDNLEAINNMPSKTKNEKNLQGKAYQRLMESLSDRNRKVLHELALYINAASGRGDLPFGAGKAAAPLLNGLFFSPRLIMSRVTMLNPFYYAALPAPVRKRALWNLTKTGAIATTIMSLAIMAGLDVEPDPRSSDFGKLRSGSLRYDILGGSAQYITLASRLVMNETKTIGGDVKTLGGYGNDDAVDVIARFAQNKTSPLTSFWLDAVRRENVIGEEFTLPSAIATRLTPLMLQDYVELLSEDAFNDNGEFIPLGAAAATGKILPVIFGVGMQNFDTVPNDSMLRIENNSESPVVQELDRLYSIDNKRVINNPRRNVNIDGTGARDLTPDEYDRYKELTELYILDDLSYVIGTAAYENLSDEEKIDEIRAIAKDARADARADLATELSTGEQQTPASNDNTEQWELVDEL